MILIEIACGFGFAFLLAFAANHFALSAWRLSVGQHWTERARRLYPVRVSAAVNLVTIPLLLLVAGSLALQGELPAVVLLSAIPGTLLGNYTLDRQIYPGLRPRRWISLTTMVLTLHASFWMVPLIAAFLIPSVSAVTGLLLRVGVFSFGAFCAADGWIYPLRWLGMLHAAPATVDSLARRVAMEKGVPLKEVWVLDVPSSNAFALLFRGGLGFTSRFLELHPESEIVAVTAHELGHLTESRWVRAGRFLSHFVLYPLVFIGPATRAFGLIGIVVVILVSLGLLRFRQSLTRRMEKRADAHAVMGTGEGIIYAQALSRLYETNQMPATMPKRSKMPHPDLYDRLLAAGVTPDYPRPNPPASRASTGLAITTMFVVALVARVLMAANLDAAPQTLENGGPETGRSVLFPRPKQKSLALYSGRCSLREPCNISPASA